MIGEDTRCPVLASAGKQDHASTHVSTLIQTHTYIFSHTNIHVPTYTHHIYTHTCTYTHTETHSAYTHTHACKYTLKHAHILTQTCTLVHTLTHMHIYSDIHIYTPQDDS